MPSPNQPGAATAFGSWFIGLAAITWVGTVAATRQNRVLTAVLFTLAAGATLNAIALMAGISSVGVIAALVLVLSSLIAFYAGSAVVLNSAFGRTVLPMGERP